MLSVIMLNVIMLNVIMLNVIILKVVMLNVVAPLKPQTVLQTMSSCIFKAIERNIFKV
jgi:hypothetical protein